MLVNLAAIRNGRECLSLSLSFLLVSNLLNGNGWTWSHRNIHMLQLLQQTTTIEQSLQHNGKISALPLVLNKQPSDSGGGPTRTVISSRSDQQVERGINGNLDGQIFSS